MTRPALIVTHLDEGRSGLVAECFAAVGCPTIRWDPPGAGPPALGEIAGIVSLGGLQSATRLDREPDLAAEVDLMRQALAANVPILGMCLGAQLLAVAAEGRVRPMGHKYVGWSELTMRPGAARDPVFGTLDSGLAVLKWHEDMIDMPPGAELLGETPVTPGTALFRVGASAWGSQAHLEVDAAMLLDGWLANQTELGDIIAAGHDLEAFREESRRRLERQTAAARPVFTRFAELIRDRAGAASVTAAEPLRLTGVTRPSAAEPVSLAGGALLPSGSSTNTA